VRRRLVISCIVAMIGISLCMGSAVLGATKEPKSAEILPVTVKLDELTNILTGQEAIIVDMVFVVSNPNPFYVNVKQLEWTVGVEKTRLGTLAVPEGLIVPPKGEARVRKTYFLNAKAGPVNLLLSGAVMNLEQGGKAFGEISKAIAEERAVWNLEGAAYIEGKDATKSVPFSIEWKPTPPVK
jgi:LEA14-like dessication related protein